MIRRTAHVRAISRLLIVSPVVAILGARQVGKTTLALQIAAGRRGPSRVFDLENDDDRASLSDPMRVLSPLRGLVVLDEVQHVPDLFRTLRVLADRPGRPARFLVVGSANERLLKQSSESLAGRIAFHELPPLSLDEVGRRRLDRLWSRGGFPGSFLAVDDDESVRWRKDFIRTFVERDLPQLGVTIPAATMSKFWSMLAHVHGQVWNASRIASGFGVAHTTVMRWLDLLTATYVVRVLAPWHENLGKRQVKAPKVYLADTGLLHAFHDVASVDRLEGHPIAGPSWESLGIETVVNRLGARPGQCYFWATHQGAELDLFVVAGGRRLGFEFKRTSAPTLTPSMRIALADLRLDSLVVVHAGTHEFPMADRVRAVPLSRVPELVKPLAPRRR